MSAVQRFTPEADGPFSRKVREWSERPATSPDKLPEPTTLLESVVRALFFDAMKGNRRSAKDIRECVDGPRPDERVTYHVLGEPRQASPSGQRQLLADTDYRRRLLELEAMEAHADDGAEGAQPGRVRPDRFGGPVEAQAPPGAAE